MEISPRNNKQIEVLRMEWKRFPPLLEALRELKEILKYPEKYLIKVGEKDTRDLDKEVSSRHPLSAFTVFIELPVTSKTPFGTANFGDEKNFVQIHFSLTKTASESPDEEFGTNIIFLSGDGQSLSGRAEIRLTSGKILTPEDSVTKEQTIWTNALCNYLTESSFRLKGLKATLWTGLAGELHKKAAEVT